MNQNFKSNLTSRKHWLRLLFMVFFAICLQLASFIVSVVIGVQFLFALITGKDNYNLRQFGDSSATYIAQCLIFLTYNSDDKPFPFADWPEPSTALLQEDIVSEDEVASSAIFRGNGQSHT